LVASCGVAFTPTDTEIIGLRTTGVVIQKT
jgi:hypothetical protein